MARGKAPTFELQRGAIMVAAAGLFAQKGFHNASMAEIAAACGVSKPLLYHYYRDKEHLLFDIADSYIDQLLDVTIQVEAQRLGAEEQVAALIGGFLEQYGHAQAHHIVLVQDVKFLQQTQAEKINTKQRKVVGAVSRALHRIDPELARSPMDKPVAMILFGMINWTYTWLRDEGPLTFRDMAPVVTAIFLNGFRGYMNARRQPQAAMR